jgi:hypothetical protein
MHYRIACLACAVILLSTSCQQPLVMRDETLPHKPADDVPEVRIDAPWRVPLGVPFRMSVTYYVPSDDKGAPPQTAVSADDTGEITYEPSDFVLKANETKDVRVTVNSTTSGLAELMVTDDCCEDPRLSIETGFRGRVAWDAGQALESQTSQWATLSILDPSDRPLALDAPVSLDVKVSGALIRLPGENTWHHELPVHLPHGSSGSPTFEILPQPLFSTEGTVQVRGFLNDESFVLFDSSLRFKILPPWWIRLGVTVLGAILYSLYPLIQKSTGPLRLAVAKAILAGAFGGLFAWALADWNVLGIKTDPEHLTGYFVLGLLTAYAGVEPAFEKLAQRKDKPPEESRDEMKRGAAAETKDAAVQGT